MSNILLRRLGLESVHNGRMYPIPVDNEGIAMNVLFNNKLLYVIDYPGHDALEILDKRNGRMGLLRGTTADRMRNEFGEFLMKEHDQEEFENFIDSYEAILNHSVSRH